MVNLIVRIHCKKEKTSEAKTFFKTFVPKARSEEGCLYYDFLVSRDEQGVFYFIEKWTSQELFEKHLKQTYVEEFRSRFDELLEEKNQLTYLTD